MSKTPHKQFASTARELTANIRGAIVEYVTDDYGRARERQVDKELVAQFRPMTESAVSFSYARAVAARAFYPQSAWRDSNHTSHAILGAIPSTIPEPMYHPVTGSLQGMTQAYDPTMMFGFFDTGWEPNDARRKELNDALDGLAQRDPGVIEIVAEALPLPWPSYDKIAPQGADRKIAATVRDLELDVHAVIAYEQATKNREAVLAALAELAGADDAAATENAALERVL